MLEKLKSRKFLVAIWAMVLITTLTIWSMATGFSPEWFNILMPFLSIIIGSWIGIEGLIDKNNIKK